MKRTQQQAGLPSSTGPSKRRKANSLPNSFQLTDRTKARTTKSFAPSRILLNLTQEQGTFDPESFNLNPSRTANPSLDQSTASAAPPQASSKDDPFNLQGLLSSLLADVPLSKPTLPLPQIPHPSTNPFFNPSMTLAHFAIQTKINVDAALGATSHWSQLPSASFVTLAYKLQGRNNLIAFCMDLIFLAQLLSMGREDWELTHLPFEFFDDVVPVLKEVEELVGILASRNGCSWLRDTAGRPCSVSGRALVRVRDMRRELETLEGWKRLERKRVEDEEERKRKEYKRKGWQGE